MSSLGTLLVSGLGNLIVMVLPVGYIIVGLIRMVLGAPLGSPFVVAIVVFICLARGNSFSTWEGYWLKFHL